MIATERASYILNKLRDKDTVTLKEIAAELGVSEATIKAHVSAVLHKLGVDSRTQAVILLSRIGSEPQPAAS